MWLGSYVVWWFYPHNTEREKITFVDFVLFEANNQLFANVDKRFMFPT